MLSSISLSPINPDLVSIIFKAYFIISFGSFTSPLIKIFFPSNLLKAYTYNSAILYRAAKSPFYICNDYVKKSIFLTVALDLNKIS